MRRNSITLICILAGAILWVGLTSWQTHLKTRMLEKTSLESVAPSSLQPSPVASVLPAQVRDALDPQELEFTLPDRDTYRTQVMAREKQEGAGLPPVLREFSLHMTALMEKASQSPAFAAALFDRLKNCSAAREGTIDQARTICAVNAIRLGEIHPQTLGSKASSFRDSLPARLKTSVIALGF